MNITCYPSGPAYSVLISSTRYYGTVLHPTIEAALEHAKKSLRNNPCCIREKISGRRWSISELEAALKPKRKAA